MLSRVKRLARSPLLHFAAAGALIFVAWEWAQPVPDSPENLTPSLEATLADHIELTPAELKIMLAYFASQWRRLPTEVELEALVERRITEEVLMREALKLGLDRGDQVVRRRLSQKLEMTLDEIAAVGSPPETELVDFYKDHADRYVEPARVSFEHRFVGKEGHGDAALESAYTLLERLRLGEVIQGDPFHLPSLITDETSDRLERAFGPSFAATLLGLVADGGEWEGPVESPWGQHLVRVTSFEPPRQIPFEEARATVASDWREAAAESRVRDRLQEMRRKYRVSVPPLDEISGLLEP